MAVLPIYVAPHPVLKKVADPVKGGVTDELRTLMDDMLDTVYAAPGIGLAAPQIGVSKRVVVIDLADQERGEERQPKYFVNPEIVWESENLSLYSEGCLSVPDQFSNVERPEKVRIKYLDYKGAAQEEEYDGLMATCIQHEIDHLDGILFVDHLSSLKRSMILRKVKKWTRANEEDIAESHIVL